MYRWIMYRYVYVYVQIKMTQLSNFKCESTPNKQHMNHGGKEKFPLTRILIPSHSNFTFKEFMISDDLSKHIHVYRGKVMKDI